MDRRLWRLLLLTMIAAGLLLSAARSGRAAGQPITVPAGFEAHIEAPGVTVYERAPADGEPEYVQVVDLGAGARLELWHGAMEDAGVGEGIYGGNSPRFQRQFLPDVWQSLAAEISDVVCLSNGSYFKDTIDGMWVDPTQLAFPLKKDGVMLSEGYERYRFSSRRQMLELWPDRARITPYSLFSLRGSTAPDVVVGLDAGAPVRASERLGRTMIGVLGEGEQEVLLIYNGAAVTQREARETLRAFGARNVMMLDGGGSTQLSCLGADYIEQVRPLPQMLATISAVAVEPPADDLTRFERNLARWLGWLFERVVE